MDPAATPPAPSCRGVLRTPRLLVYVAAALSFGGYVHGGGVAASASSVRKASTCAPKKPALVKTKAKRKQQPAIKAKAAATKRATAADCAPPRRTVPAKRKPTTASKRKRTPVSKHTMTSKRSF
jgi:hypothetical protein